MPSCPFGFSRSIVEIHPFTLRRDLEFLVAADALEVGPDERLGDVPVPEPRRLRRTVRDPASDSARRTDRCTADTGSRFVQRERISVGGPAIGSPVLSRSASTRGAIAHSSRLGSRVELEVARRVRALEHGRVARLTGDEREHDDRQRGHACAYFTGSRSTIAEILKSGTQNSVAFPGWLQVRQPRAPAPLRTPRTWSAGTGPARGRARAWTAPPACWRRFPLKDRRYSRARVCHRRSDAQSPCSVP